MKPLPIVNMSPADCNALRNWASSYGAAVRQRNNAKRPPWHVMAHSQNLCTKGNAGSQISLSPFRVSKGRSLEPWSPVQKPFSTWSPDKNADSGQIEPYRVQPWSPIAPVFLSRSSGALYFLPIAFDKQVNTADAATAAPAAKLDDDEANEYDESSDEEVEDRPDDSTLLQGEIGSSATFLLGARTRFGRVVRFNNRLLY